MSAVALRNMLNEMGLWQTTATVIYQDNQPAIRIAYNDGSLTQRSRTLDLQTLKIRQLIEHADVMLKYCKTKKMLVDVGTKVTPADQFKWMRDALSGYLIEVGNSIPEGANWTRH